MTEQIKPVEIHFNVPPRNAPGFYYRQRRAFELQKLKTDNPTVEVLDSIVEFLADYVVADSREKQIELMHMASEEQWDMALDAIGGKKPEAIPPVTSEPSESLSKVTT